MKDKFKFSMDFEQKSVDTDNGVITIEGYANTESVDRAQDKILASAWVEGVKHYKGALLAGHDHSKIVGKVVSAEPREKGLWVVAEVHKGVEAGDLTYNQVKKGLVNSFSVGFRALDADYDEKADVFIIKEVELFEISIVAVGCERNAGFTVKSYEEKDVTVATGSEEIQTGITGLRQQVLKRSSALAAVATINDVSGKFAVVPYTDTPSDSATFSVEVKGKKVAVARSMVEAKITETTKEDLAFDPTSVMNQALLDSVQLKLEKALSTWFKAGTNLGALTSTATSKTWDTVVKSVMAFPENVRKTSGVFHVFLNDETYKTILLDRDKNYNAVTNLGEQIQLHSLAGLEKTDLIIGHSNGLLGRVKVDRAAKEGVYPATESTVRKLGYSFGIGVIPELVKKLTLS